MSLNVNVHVDTAEWRPQDVVCAADPNLVPIQLKVYHGSRLYSEVTHVSFNPLNHPSRVYALVVLLGQE